jgi:thiamine biosynthesis lipoprotein
MQGWRHVAGAALAAALLAGAPPRAQEAPHRESRRLMGTLCDVQVHHPDAGLARRAATAALDEMARVDALLSNYKPDSELSRMNREAPRAPFQASPELFEFVSLCRRFHEDSQGTFDPTVGAVVRAWGFLGATPAPPAAADASAARARSGFDKVRLDAAARTVSYSVDGLELDPGGIGKGYAVDMAVQTLRRLGISSALVSAGGSTLYALGHPPDRDTWRLAIDDPSSLERPLRYVALRNAAVSTSGVSRRSVRDGSRQFSHLFDPRSGEPAQNMCQASVVTATATESDALTKAAFILPRDVLLDLLERKNRAVHVLRVDGPCDTPSPVWTTPWSSDVFLAVM